MIEVRISGANTQELIQQTGELLVLLANGAKLHNLARQQGAAPKEVNPAPEQSTADPFPATDTVGAETIAEPMENPKAGGKPKATRGKKTAAQEIIDAEPIETTKPIEATVDDVKNAVRVALENAQKRAEAEYPSFDTLKGKQLEDANKAVMAAKVAYVKPLLLQFGAAKVSDLKPEQYGAFVAAAQAFIDGEA